MRTGFAAAALTLGLASGVWLPAQAQMFNQVGKNSRSEQPPAAVAPPPALPGSGPGKATAPLTRVPTDMEPNDALFDSINRGDIATARDAISRGADLHARNILGMTPLELSIDLGRNDISFMLLSMRAGDDTRPAQAQRAAAAKDNAKQPVRQAKKASPRPVTPAPAAQQTARLFSGDGGTPNPNAGFLGFDSGRR
jgi:ankyrin repeat protein